MKVVRALQNVGLKVDVKVRDHCHVTGKYRTTATHRNFNINVSLNYNISIVFHNPKEIRVTFYYARTWQI